MRFVREALLLPLFAGLLAAAPAARADDARLEPIFAEASARAAALAAAPYATPAADLPEAFHGADYDAYRKLRPRPDRTVWGTAGNPFGVLPLPRGWLYPHAVNVHLVGRDGAVSAFASPDTVDFVDYPGATDGDRARLGASGFRAITKPGIAGDGYEFAVFQGGTYFRAVGKGQTYGVSARALAIGTGSSQEEFPTFTDFWVLEPAAGDDTLHVVALSDSSSAAAAYRFALRPGSDAIIDVAAEIHPRIDVSEIGVAPLSSMYLHGPADQRLNAGAANGDQRPEVHDSDGLSIVLASGERIWRPLANPKTVQVSALVGRIARFGLEQRQRAPAAYADGEAKYETRPSIFIEPVGDWGAGDVHLLEIPTANEYADNIAAFWRPAEVWRAGEAYRIAYRLRVGDGSAQAGPARVVATRIAPVADNPALRRFTLEFAGGSLIAEGALRPDLWATAGRLSAISLSRNASGAATLSFNLEPGDAPVVELHAALAASSQLTETWLFRWTPD
jgi:glucans biosynthesis protein